MAYGAETTYVEDRVYSADPLELVQILYETTIESVERARRYLRQGKIAERSREISRASAVLVELSLSVRQDVGGALAQNLIELYDYMQRRLIEANVEQKDAPLAEVARLMGTLLEGWLSLKAESKPWETAPAPPVEVAAEHVEHAWSF